VLIPLLLFQEGGRILTLGEFFRHRRLEKGLSLRKLAKLSGVYFSTLSRIERGRNKHPELRTVAAIIQVLDIPHEDVMIFYKK